MDLLFLGWLAASFGFCFHKYCINRSCQRGGTAHRWKSWVLQTPLDIVRADKSLIGIMLIQTRQCELCNLTETKQRQEHL